MEQNNQLEKKEIIYSLVNREYIQPHFKDDISLKNCTKLKIEQIGMLGAAFVPVTSFLSQVFSPSFQTSATNLYAAFDKAGNPVQLTNYFHGENAQIGALLKNGKIAEQARFKKIPVKDIPNVESGFNPATMMIAVQLLYISKQVTEIKKQQKELCEYLKDEKRAHIEAELSFLTTVLNEYKYNIDNETYKTSMHIKVMDIKETAEKNIQAARKHLRRFIDKNKNEYEALIYELQNYQTSVYLYSFSSFVEIIVLENLSKDYLEHVQNQIYDLSFAYKELYTECYVFLEESKNNSIGSLTLDAASKISGTLGELIAKTPGISQTQLDETLISGEEKLKTIKETGVSKAMKLFSHYKDTNVNELVEIIKRINRIFHEESVVMFDENYLYITD